MIANNYFLGNISYEKLSQDDGKQRKVSEQYLIDAISFSEAENRLIKEMEPYIQGEFKVLTLTRYNVSEIVPANWSINEVDAEAKKLSGQNNYASADLMWFKCKINYIMVNDKGAQKKVPAFVLIEASSVNAANDTLVEYMHGSMADWVVEKIEETKILEIFNIK